MATKVKVLNPLTNRKVTVGGSVYKRLIKEGVIEAYTPIEDEQPQHTYEPIEEEVDADEPLEAVMSETVKSGRSQALDGYEYVEGGAIRRVPKRKKKQLIMDMEDNGRGTRTHGPLEEEVVIKDKEQPDTDDFYDTDESEADDQFDTDDEVTDDEDDESDEGDTQTLDGLLDSLGL